MITRFLSLLFAIGMFPITVSAIDIYVSTSGHDANNDGSLASPYRTLSKAKSVVQAVLPSASEPINVWVRGGTYYLGETIEFGPADSGSASAPVTYSAYLDEAVVLSGAIPLSPSWSVHSGDVEVANVGTNLVFDMLFVDGEAQVMARYPNYDPDVRILNGYSSDAASSSRAARWSNPSTGFVRGLHGNRWGGNSFKITGLSGGNPTLEWVGDNNRGSGLHSEYRMVENLFEELDAPGEWFYDESAGYLYFYPPDGVDTATATFEAASLEELIRVVGTSSEKVSHLTFTKFTFTHTHRTLFTGSYEPMNRSDWRLVRSGAIYLEDAENVTISDSVFDTIGGNGVFMSDYNRDHLITNNEFLDNGATCVNVCGSKAALWDVNEWEDYVTEAVDIGASEIGPKTDDYPKDITISYNHMYNMGRFEKQTAGVNLFLAESITIGHNTIHSSPRSGINICDGAWGGHIIEHNDVFDCIRETHDHGPFNSWGRDRFYSIGGYNHNGSDGAIKRPFAFHEAWKTTYIRNNRFHYEEPTEFGIDLDDGSSNYEIYNNLILNTSVKLREGFSRKVYNNIIINRGLDLHVWYAQCQDEIYNNIIVNPLAYHPINVGGSDEQATTDYNLFYNGGDVVDISNFNWAASDENSITANPEFVDVSTLDFTVEASSPALGLGFVNFPMDQFGKPGSPEPGPVDFVQELPANSDAEPLMGASASSIYDGSWQSALGSPDLNGVFLEVVQPSSFAAGQGFEEWDVIRSINGTDITDKQSFWLLYHLIEPGAEIAATILRNQHIEPLTFTKPSVGEELNSSAGVVYAGAWAIESDIDSFNKVHHATSSAGDSFELTFYGTGISLTSQNGADMGLVDVYLDGVLVETVDLFSPDRLHQQVIYSRSGLDAKQHTLRVVNQQAQKFTFDSFTITPVRSILDVISVTSSGSSIAPVASATDLAQIEYESSAGSSGDVESKHGDLFNGLVGNDDGDVNDSGEVRISTGEVFTITFDTSVNTLGYDITHIDSYFGWDTDGGGRSNQGYSLRFNYIDGSSELLEGTHWAPNSPADYWTKVTFTNVNGGAIAKRVKSLTFTITNGANASGVVIAREVDVFGAPTTSDGVTPVAHWKFDEVSGTQVLDSTGNGHHCSVVSESWDEGLDGGALEFDGSGTSVVLPESAFTYINYEITLAMWVYGSAELPKNHSIFYANADTINRVLNIHLPWSDSRVYWDAGNTGAGYDRISKDAALDEFKGQWNHWVFTKDAHSGDMSIFLNGALWHSGTGLTNPMSGISEASFGSNMGTGNFYSGVVDDLKLFYVALDAAEVSELYGSYTVMNGVPQAWLFNHGLETTDAGALTNSDGDRLLAWQEYHAGTDPLDGQSVFQLKEMDLTETGFDVEWQAVAGKIYDVWFCKSLEDDWLLEIAGVAGVEPTTNVSIVTDEPSGFVKITVR